MKTWFQILTPGIGLGFCIGVPALLSIPGIGAQTPKDSPQPKVQILLADRWPIPTPLTKDQTKLTLRGLGLDSIEKVEAIPKTGAPVPLKIIKKEKSGPPANRDSAQAGDSQLELEFAAGMPAPISLRFHSKGTPAQLDLAWMGAPGPFQMEKEPNGGFGEGQPIAQNQLILGNISPAKDVDVFFVTSPTNCKSLLLSAEKGDQLTLLRPFLMIHTAQGDLVKAFEWGGSLPIVVPVTGQTKYFISIADAHDSTSSFHHYAFRVEFR